VDVAIFKYILLFLLGLGNHCQGALFSEESFNSLPGNELNDSSENNAPRK